MVSKQNHKKKNKQKNQEKINVIFNYSNVELTPFMLSVLNRGLNFSVLPKNLDLTQVLTELKRFERTMVWKEFWNGQEKEENDLTKHIFKVKKTNFPKNYQIPQELKTFLAAIKSELLDPRNRRFVNPNLTMEEINALGELITLQMERKIVIKPCD